MPATEAETGGVELPEPLMGSSLSEHDELQLSGFFHQICYLRREAGIDVYLERSKQTRGVNGITWIVESVSGVETLSLDVCGVVALWRVLRLEERFYFGNRLDAWLQWPVHL